ncbi:MAG: hypothetical protein IVW54_07830 [Candidatus Binataceae bacterium]|nr:hypothetical protein [Candidatus Binataceae bacterium]
MTAIDLEHVANRKKNGNPVIFIALALPAMLVVIALSNTVRALYPQPVESRKAIEQPVRQSEPARLIPAQSMKFVG